ncbi:MAG: transposase [Nitrospirae bacterium]|nr:transposase [Nitrospirota bacterium]
MLGKRFEAFVEQSPVSVMVRGVLERAFDAGRLDALFEKTAERGYTRELLFSTVVRLMSEVVLGVSPSVHAAYQDASQSPGVSIAAVYDKLAGLETQVSAELVRDSVRQLSPVICCLGGEVPSLLDGYRVLILDGNHLSGSEHRIKPLRRMRAAALPGQALVVLDPQWMLIVDVLPWEDAHAQERSLLEQMVPRVQPRDLWIDDRNFCTTKFLFGIARRQGCFLVRQHASTLHWQLLGKRQSRGRVPTGRVYEQTVHLDHPETGESLLARRITVELDKPTRDGDKEIHLLTNLPVEDADVRQVAGLYTKRWTIEKVFQDLTVALTCEIHTLGYPKAALFGFCLALVAYNAVSLIQAALRAVHGSAKTEAEVSWYYVCLHLSKVYTGMMIALPARDWDIFRRLEVRDFAALLKELALKIDLRRFRKHPRGPKRPQPRKLSGVKISHVSTARVLAQQSP